RVSWTLTRPQRFYRLAFQTWTVLPLDLQREPLDNGRSTSELPRPAGRHHCLDGVVLQVCRTSHPMVARAGWTVSKATTRLQPVRLVRAWCPVRTESSASESVVQESQGHSSTRCCISCRQLSSCRTIRRSSMSVSAHPACGH